jgi:hypothetical protein
MKNEPITQSQHRVSQVYLKEFGYKEDSNYLVSVYQIGKTMTENLLVEKFTADTNIFDLPFNEPEIKRYFENTSNLVENRYKTVISNLHNQKQLIPLDKDLLCHFVANLMCRSELLRNFIELLLKSDRDNLLKEITVFSGHYEALKIFLSKINPEQHLNIVICSLMDYLVVKLRSFNQIVIKSHEDVGWFTTDNPVYVDAENNQKWLIPVSSEIYLPLSKDFCLFMYNPNSKKENDLRKLKVDKVHVVDSLIFNNIMNKLTENANKYLILPEKLENTHIANLINLKL